MDSKSQYKASAKAYYHRIFTLACFMLGSREDAEDVTQEVLVKLWHHYAELRPETMEPWVLRVTRNACLDALRSRATRHGVVNPVAHDELPDMPGGDGRDTLERNELRRGLADAIGALEEPYRSVLILREINEYAYQEIADTLELPLNTTKTYLHRGRRMLREALRGKVALNEH